MITRVMKLKELPVHSVTIDEFGEICQALISRFTAKGNVECTIILKTAGFSAVSFESVEDMIANKSEIKERIGKYFIELENYDNKVGRQLVEILPPFYENTLNFRSMIRAYSRDEGWCADIIATAVSQFNRFSSKFDWFYNRYVCLLTNFSLALIAGAIVGRLWDESLLSFELKATITLTCFVCAGIVCWMTIGKGMQGRTAEIRFDRKRAWNWSPLLIILLMILQIALAIISIYLSQ